MGYGRGGGNLTSTAQARHHAGLWPTLHVPFGGSRAFRFQSCQPECTLVEPGVVGTAPGHGACFVQPDLALLSRNFQGRVSRLTNWINSLPFDVVVRPVSPAKRIFCPPEADFFRSWMQCLALAPTWQVHSTYLHLLRENGHAPFGPLEASRTLRRRRKCVRFDVVFTDAST